MADSKDETSGLCVGGKGSRRLHAGFCRRFDGVGGGGGVTATTDATRVAQLVDAKSAKMYEVCKELTELWVPDLGPPHGAFNLK